MESPETFDFDALNEYPQISIDDFIDSFGETNARSTPQMTSQGDEAVMLEEFQAPLLGKRAQMLQANAEEFDALIKRYDVAESWDYNSPGDAVAEAFRAKALNNEQEGKRHKIVPLSGIVASLVNDYEVSGKDLARLLEQAAAYCALPDTVPTKKVGEERQRALANIAQILNKIAQRENCGALARDGSKCQYLARKVNGHTVGSAMQAKVSLNPGNLVGYAPVDTGASNSVKQSLGGGLSGFVRAHLLNKHLGGPGTAENIGFVYNKANLQMSEAVEEFVKKATLEDNREFIFEVEMPHDGEDPMIKKIEEDYPGRGGFFATSIVIELVEIKRTETGEQQQVGFDFAELGLDLGELGVTQVEKGRLEIKCDLPDTGSVIKIAPTAKTQPQVMHNAITSTSMYDFLPNINQQAKVSHENMLLDWQDALQKSKTRKFVAKQKNRQKEEKSATERLELLKQTMATVVGTSNLPPEQKLEEIASDRGAYKAAMKSLGYKMNGTKRSKPGDAAQKRKVEALSGPMDAFVKKSKKEQTADEEEEDEDEEEDEEEGQEVDQDREHNSDL